MKPLRGFVRGMGLWAPGHATLANWVAGESAVDPELTKPKAAMLSSRLRRRTSLMTRMVASAVEEAADQGRADRSALRYVITSAWGELKTTVDLLESMCTGDGRVSPTAFTNSVHNTPTGYLSIASANRLGSNAVAAGSEGVAMGFLDAMLTLVEDGNDVMLTLAEEAIPPPFGVPGETHTLAAALHISSRRAEGALNLAVELTQGAGGQDPEDQDPADGDPLDFTWVCLAPLMRALHAGAPARVPLSRYGPWTLVIAPESSEDVA
jgi:hypothetical protein